jgi:predicted dehydrogenase
VTERRIIRFGVLGTARVVSYGLLAPAREIPGVNVIGIASRTLQKAKDYAAAHGIQHGFGSYEALLEYSDIDAVYVALPTALHYQWARRAMEAGKHVLCEKPLAANAQLAQELADCARQHNRVLVEGMHLPYSAQLRRQRDLIASGEFGRLLRIESCFRATFARMAKDDFRQSFELGGGATLDLGCYAVSCLRYLAREEPEVLSARCKCLSPQVDRWMRAECRFPSGVEGVAECGFRGFYTPRAGVAVTCERGSIKWGGRGLVYNKNGKAVEEQIAPTPTFRLQLESFAKSIRGEKSDALSLDESLLTARLLDSMYSKAGLAIRGMLHEGSR